MPLDLVVTQQLLTDMHDHGHLAVECYTKTTMTHDNSRDLTSSLPKQQPLSKSFPKSISDLYKSRSFYSTRIINLRLFCVLRSRNCLKKFVFEHLYCTIPSHKTKQLVRVLSTHYGLNLVVVYPFEPYFFNPLKTKLRLLYLKPQSVPRCKHFSSRL